MGSLRRVKSSQMRIEGKWLVVVVKLSIRRVRIGNERLGANGVQNSKESIFEGSKRL